MEGDDSTGKVGVDICVACGQGRIEHIFGVSFGPDLLFCGRLWWPWDGRVMRRRLKGIPEACDWY